MLPLEHLDRIQITFDDHRLVNNAGLLLPATLALNLGLRQLVDHHLDLGDAPGRANAGDKMMTLIASALAGGDCIDDADALRAGGTAGVLDCTVKAPSTLGTFLRSFRWGHVRQLDRVSRELLARAWAAGAGPGDAPFTIDRTPPSATSAAERHNISCLSMTALRLLQNLRSSSRPWTPKGAADVAETAYTFGSKPYAVRPAGEARRVPTSIIPGTGTPWIFAATPRSKTPT